METMSLLTVRIEPEIKRDLQAEARRREESLNTVVREILRAYLEMWDKDQDAAEPEGAEV